MPARPALCSGLLLAALSACTGPAIGWTGLPATEDPAPSGPNYLRDYKESYYRSLGTQVVTRLTERELVERIARTRVLFLADVHDDVELHGRMLVLLDHLKNVGLNMILGVEAVGTQDARALRNFATKRTELPEFRSQLTTRWPDSWLDNPQVDSAFYTAVLDRARSWSIPVFALEPTPRVPLYERDFLIARNIRRAAKRHPASVVVVIVGQAHTVGSNRLRELTGYPSVVLSSRPSNSLERAVLQNPPDPARPHLETDAGVILFGAE